MKTIAQYPLLNRIILYTFLFATGATLLVTSATLYSEYKSELAALQNHLAHIEKSQLDSLSNNLWTLDTRGIELQLRSILQHRDMVLAEVHHANGEVISFGQPPLAPEHTLEQEYHLYFDDYGAQIRLGKLRIVATTENLRDHLMTRIPMIIVLNLVEIAFVCGFILLLFILLFNRRLNQIAVYCTTLNFDTLETALQLPGKKERTDELDRIVAAINDMRTRLLDDIQQREEAERSLRESEKRFRDLCNNSSDWIWEFDENDIFTFASSRVKNLLGYEAEEVIGLSAFDLIPPAERENVKNEFVLIKKQREPFANLLNINQHKNGRLLTIESSGVPIIDAKGTFRGYRGIDRDITERKKMEEELHQAQKMESIGTLAGGIAHDFNNILAAIIGYTELAISERTDPASAKKDLRQVLQGANRAKELVRQILTFSRKTDQQRQPIRIQSITKEALNLVRSSLPTTIDIQQDIEPASGTVLANPTQIHQVVMNICTNAYHAMRRTGGVLRVTLRQVLLEKDDLIARVHLEPGEYLQLEISDTGIGMEAEIAERIFEPYFSTKEKGEGTGLGLAVVHGIVTSMQGDISVSSEPGRGTTFTILLPVLETSEDSAQENNAPLPIPTGSEHVLLVDDDKALATLFKAFLEHLGYHATALFGSQEALKAFEESGEKFDLVITDMTMPKMTGIELARRLLAIKPDLPIILCTGYSDLVNEEQAKAAGIRDFLMKPISQRVLATAVRQVLDEG